MMRNEYEGPLIAPLNELNNRFTQSECAHEIIDKYFDELICILHRGAEVLPRTKFVSHLKPYWDNELTNLKKEKMRCFKIWKENGRSRDNENPIRIAMCSSKKAFAKRLRQISRGYFNEQIADATRYAEVDRNYFWKVFRKSKGGNKSTSHAIKNSKGEVVYTLEEVLGVWREHFDKISSPKQSSEFDSQHFKHVSEAVMSWCRGADVSPSLLEPFSFEEIKSANLKLHLSKAPGFDNITTEHIRFAGHALISVLCNLYNACVKLEYIPLSFRKGVQIPLYKGKGSCSLSPDNYRGITLLSNFNKMFEVPIWSRLEGWWVQNRVVSDLQGACRKGSSCIHTALTLQETISKERERHSKVFVAYFDVSKAFDSVWIDGLFFQLYNLGIKDSLWRMLYKMYIEFSCCVRIGNLNSTWYSMGCGIHQGGFLSLMKYTVFIDSLLRQLENSGLCCSVFRTSTSPVGYADDLAASTINKLRMDRVMEVVFQHSCKWRYSFNPGKSAFWFTVKTLLRKSQHQYIVNSS